VEQCLNISTPSLVYGKGNKSFTLLFTDTGINQTMNVRN